MYNHACRYVIVTPVRDEEESLPYTIASVVGQTIRPIEWVIVDDGSSDSTGTLIQQYARQYTWIRAVHRNDRGFRQPGAGIIEAFYAGYQALTCHDWDYLAKLDGDLSFEPDYFEKLLDRFTREPGLGIAGGTLYHFQNGVKTLERCPRFHVRGGAKVYRKACWEAIGGLWSGYGSDTVDEVTANMQGWKSRSFSDLEMWHHRFTGAAYGRWGALVKDGRADYVVGYHPVFLLAKCGVRLFRRPYLLGSLGLLYGYASSWRRRLPRVGDAAVIRYLRAQQLARLYGRESIWH